MIRNFDLLRDAYRYMGMFDKLYLDTSNAALTQWTKHQLISLPWSGVPSEDMVRKHPQGIAAS